MDKINDDGQPAVGTVQLDALPDREVPPAERAAADATNLATDLSPGPPVDGSDSEPREVDQAEGPGAKHAGRFAWLKITSLVAGKNGRGGAPLDVADLVECLELRPQLHNITVRPVEGVRNRYEIIAGHRRVEASRLLGRLRVPAMVFNANDAEAEIYGLEENLRRKPVGDEIKAKARLVALLEKNRPTGRGGDRKSEVYKSNVQLGRTVETAVAAVAKITGSSKGAVRRAARIEKRAVAAVKEALNNGVINVNEADGLGSVEGGQQAQELAALIASKARDRAAPVLKKIRASFEYLDSKFTKPQEEIPREALQEFRLRAAALINGIDKLTAGSVT